MLSGEAAGVVFAPAVAVVPAAVAVEPAVAVAGDGMPDAFEVAAALVAAGAVRAFTRAWKSCCSLAIAFSAGSVGVTPLALGAEVAALETGEVDADGEAAAAVAAVTVDPALPAPLVEVEEGADRLCSRLCRLLARLW